MTRDDGRRLINLPTNYARPGGPHSAIMTTVVIGRWWWRARKWNQLAERIAKGTWQQMRNEAQKHNATISPDAASGWKWLELGDLPKETFDHQITNARYHGGKYPARVVISWLVVDK